MLKKGQQKEQINTDKNREKPPSEALEEAIDKGIQNLLLYVPDMDVVNIYYAY